MAIKPDVMDDEPLDISPVGDVQRAVDALKIRGVRDHEIEHAVAGIEPFGHRQTGNGLGEFDKGLAADAGGNVRAQSLNYIAPRTPGDDEKQPAFPILNWANAVHSLLVVACYPFTWLDIFGYNTIHHPESFNSGPFAGEQNFFERLSRPARNTC